MNDKKNIKRLEQENLNLKASLMRTRRMLYMSMYSMILLIAVSLTLFFLLIIQ